MGKPCQKWSCLASCLPLSPKNAGLILVVSSKRSLGSLNYRHFPSKGLLFLISLYNLSDASILLPSPPSTHHPGQTGPFSLYFGCRWACSLPGARPFYYRHPGGVLLHPDPGRGCPFGPDADLPRPFWRIDPQSALLGGAVPRVGLGRAFGARDLHRCLPGTAPLNYLLGMGLFTLAVLLDFTGYVLRWDEGIRWALVAGTNLIKSIPLVGTALYGSLVGGTEPGPATLIRFYGWHIFGLMLAAGILVVWHIFRVRRDGGIAVPPPALRATQLRISRFELVRRELLAMLLASVALLLLSVFAPAPLAQPFTAGSALPASVRAPWFFLWVQELLKLGNPFLWGVIVPLAVLALVTLIPYILPKPAVSEQGHWFPKGNLPAQILAGFIFLSILILTLLALIPAS